MLYIFNVLLAVSASIFNVIYLTPLKWKKQKTQQHNAVGVAARTITDKDWRFKLRP